MSQGGKTTLEDFAKKTDAKEHLVHFFVEQMDSIDRVIAGNAQLTDEPLIRMLANFTKGSVLEYLEDIQES